MGDEKKPILLTRPRGEDEKWALVQRVARSAPFQKTTRLRDFLMYVCERAIKQQTEDVREANIGHAVFGRAADYNPSEDNIVRVEARHLRKRLADYFGDEGKDEPYIILIPKGSYVPVFVPRERVDTEPEAAANDADPAPAPEAQTAPAAQPEEPAEQPRPARDRQRYVFVAALVVLAAVCVLLALQNRHMRHELGLSRLAAASYFPWNTVFDERQTKIVLADSCLVLLEDVLRRQVTLNEYVTRGYLDRIRQYEADPGVRPLLNLIASRQYTSLADVGFVGRIVQLTGGFGENVVLSYARNLNIRDFKADNFILVGAPRANPWVELFEPNMNFQFGFDESARRPFFRNKSPHPGEAAVYMTGGPDGNSAESYAVVALLPNLNHSGNVLIVEGTNMEGTEAGVEFLTDRDFEKTIQAKLGINSSSPNPYFEILLKLRTVGGTSKDVAAVSYRAIR